MGFLSTLISNILFNSIVGEVDKAAKKLQNEIVWTEKDDERVEQIIQECKEEGHRQFLAESESNGRRRVEPKWTTSNQHRLPDHLKN